MALEYVGRALALEGLEDLDLLALGHLLEHVGEPLVVERGGDLVAALVGQLVQGAWRGRPGACPRTSRAGAPRPGRAPPARSR
jgi:hypothetical protein